MKILALCLLRLGDVALCAPALRALRARYPDAHLALALNRSCAGIEALLPYVDQFFEFDRDEIQRGLGEAERPTFEPFEAMRAFADRLAAEGFDLAINFSHTRLSGYIAGFAGARRTIGLSIGEDGVPRIDSRWFGALDEQAGRFDADAFHQADVFLAATECEAAGSGLIETERGRREATDAIGALAPGGYVAAQALTSDAKKNWGLDRFEEALALFARSEPGLPVVLLGAAFERERLEPMAQALRARGVDARLAIVSIEGLHSIAKRARALLTGDTAAKHFAANAGVPCVEISVGSSDWRRTGAWSEGSVILQARALCAPCPHTRACNQPTHACALGVPPEAASAALTAAVRRDWTQMRAVAVAFGDDVDVLRVRAASTGLFHASDAADEGLEWAAGAFARIAWQMRLDGASGDGRRPEPFGERAAQLAQSVDGEAGRAAAAAAEARAAAVLRRLEDLESELNLARRSLSLGASSFPEAERVLASLRDELARSRASLPLARLADVGLNPFERSAFARARRLEAACAEIKARAQIERRLARAVGAALTGAMATGGLDRLAERTP